MTDCRLTFDIRSFVLLMILSVVSHDTQAESASENRTKVYMHYMPWFETPETLGGTNWGFHWQMKNCDPNVVLPNGQRQIASHYYPLIGPYASCDPHVIEYHLLLMKASGVDGILINWYGKQGSNGDIQNLLTNSNAIIDRIAEFDMKFAVVMEDRFAGSFDDVQANLNYIRENYVERPQYIRVGADRRPLVLIFGPTKMKDTQAWDSALQRLSSPVAMLPLWYQSKDVGSECSGEYAWIYQDETDHLTHQQRFLKNRVPNLEVAGAVVYPGFEDYYERGGVGAQVHFQIPHEDGRTLARMLGLVRPYMKAKPSTPNLDFVQLATWNDFGEGTMFEPTVETKFRYLKQLQQFTQVECGEEELRLIGKLYQARVAAKTEDQHRRLDEISAAMSRLDFDAVARLRGGQVSE